MARPAFEFNQNLFMELNLTDETLKFDPISSSIPNRGTFQKDIELFGLTYLQKISDATTGGALDIEPGIWVTQPVSPSPPESAPVGGQIVARMGTFLTATLFLSVVQRPNSLAVRPYSERRQRAYSPARFPGPSTHP